MQIIVYQLAVGDWHIKLVSKAGMVAGKTSYMSKEEAVAAAQEQHPDAEIEIEE